jgi:hypothetical protein
MNRAIRKRCVLLSLLPMVVGFGVSAYSQMAGGELAANMAENSKKLKQYTYLQKTHVYIKGDLKNTKVAQVHYEQATGEKISVPLDSETSDQSGGGRRGAFRARIVEKKKEEMKDYVESLVALMGQYLPPNGEKIKAAMPRAQVTPPSEGVAKIAFPDYVKPGDLVTFSINTETKKLDRIAIKSRLEDDPVSFQVDFARLADGTNYPSMTRIISDPKQLELRITTSDYHK